MTRARRSPPLTAPLFAALLCGAVLTPASAAAAEARYRVELIVFRNLDTPAAPDEQDTIRRFRGAFELGEAAPPEVPLPLDKKDGTFGNIWARLDRLAAYEPLVRMTYEQTLFDFHPPVRVHGDEVMAEELHIPGDLAYLDLERIDAGAGWFDDYIESLYRLDGTIQLRRSRYLHIDLDLEYRLDGPAWAREFPDLGPAQLAPGFSWVGGAPPANPAPPVQDAAGMPAPGEEDEGEASPEPFLVHRLHQSRQVRTDTLQYFDSAFLGAIVRVTQIAADPP